MSARMPAPDASTCPPQDLEAAGVGDADLLAPTTSPGLRRAVAVQVGRCDELLGAGRDLIGRLSGWPRVAVSGYVGGGLATADCAARRPLPRARADRPPEPRCAPSRTPPA